MPNTHLMIVQPHHASLILTGQKLVEARLGHDRRPPHGLVAPGDIVFIKSSEQRVIAKAVIERVDEYQGLTPADIDRLHGIYNDRVMGDEAFWATNREARIATFITLGKVRMIHDDSIMPQALRSPGREAWRVLPADTQPQRQAA